MRRLVGLGVRSARVDRELAGLGFDGLVRCKAVPHRECLARGANGLYDSQVEARPASGGCLLGTCRPRCRPDEHSGEWFGCAKAQEGGYRGAGGRKGPAGSYRFILGAVVSTESTASARIIQRRLLVPREYYDQQGVDTGEANSIPVGY